MGYRICVAIWKGRIMYHMCMNCFAKLAFLSHLESTAPSLSIIRYRAIVDGSVWCLSFRDHSTIRSGCGSWSLAERYADQNFGEKKTTICETNAYKKECLTVVSPRSIDCDRFRNREQLMWRSALYIHPFIRMLLNDQSAVRLTSAAAFSSSSVESKLYFELTDTTNEPCGGRSKPTKAIEHTMRTWHTGRITMVHALTLLHDLVVDKALLLLGWCPATAPAYCQYF